MAEGGVMVIDGEVEEALGLNDFQELLHTLQIHLPEGSLTEDIVTSSRNPIFVIEAFQIMNDLRNRKLRVAPKPRLACGRIAQVLQLKEMMNVQEITRVLFFKTRQCSEKTLKERWEENISRTSCELRIKRSYQENPTSEVMPSAEEPGNDMREIRFQIINSGISPAYYRREPVIEWGFLSGRSDFPVEGMSQIERKIIECKVLKSNVRGNLLPLPSEVKLKVTRQRYYQTLAYKYLLEKVQQSPVRALMVITEHEDNEEDLEHEDGDYHYGTMSEDTKEIGELNRFCQKEALPCFLAVLNLIFEKVKKRENEIEPLTIYMYQTLVMGLLERNLPEELRTSILSNITNAEATVLFKSGKFQDALPYPRYEQTEDGIHILQKVLNTPISVEIQIIKDSKRQDNEVKDEQNQFDQVDPQDQHQQRDNVQQTQRTDNQTKQQDLKHQQDLIPEPGPISDPGVELQTQENQKNIHQQNKKHQKGQNQTRKDLRLLKEDHLDHKDQKPEEHRGQKGQKDQSEQQDQKKKHHKDQKEEANQDNKKKKQAQKNKRGQQDQKPKGHQSQKTQPEQQHEQSQEEQKDQQDVKVKEHHQGQTGRKKRPKKKHQSLHRDQHQENKTNQQDQQEPEKHQNQEKTQEQHHEQSQEEQRDQQHQKSERHKRQKDQNKQLHKKNKKDQKPDEDQTVQEDQKDHHKIKDRKKVTKHQQGHREPKEEPSQVPKKKHHAQEKKTDQQHPKPEEDQSKKGKKGQKEKQNASDQQQVEKQQQGEDQPNQNPEGYQKAQADQENKKEQQHQDDRHETQDQKNLDKNQQSHRNQFLQRKKSHQRDQRPGEHPGKKDQQDQKDQKDHQVQKARREEPHQIGQRGPEDQRVQRDPNITDPHHHQLNQRGHCLDDQEVLGGNFNYNYVSEDSSVIEALDDDCRTEALARFLAVLNLVFEEVD